jgi:hypothetical protein
MIKEANARKDLEKLHIQTIEALKIKIDNIDKAVNFCPTNRIIFPQMQKKAKKLIVIYVHTALK